MSAIQWEDLSAAERAALDVWQRGSADTTQMILAVRAALAVEREEHEAKLWRAQNLSNGRCRWCDAVVDPNHPRAPKRPGPDVPVPVKAQPHRVDCRLYVGPLEHRWAEPSWNQTFGGYDYRCVCGGWFRQGGLAGHGDGSETAEPVCPNADQTWRGPR